MTLLLFTAIYLALFIGLSELKPLWIRIRELFTKKREVDQLRQGVLILRSLQDRLECGVIPEPDDWEKVRTLPTPWGEVFYGTLMEARDRGAPVLPSLNRMQRLLEEQAEWIVNAAAKLAPATGQALLALILVPLFGAALWALLPGIDEYGFEFGVALSISMLMGLAAFYWMTEMGERARFGHLPLDRRSWIGSSVIALERLNALVMIGQPPDLAWNEILSELQSREPALAIQWGSLLWVNGPEMKQKTGATETILIQLGHEVKRMIQTSLIEGQATLDRIEAVQRAFMTDLRGHIEQDLARLGNQSLKPLFILVMPAIVLLMAAGMLLSMRQMMT